MNNPLPLLTFQHFHLIDLNITMYVDQFPSRIVWHSPLRINIHKCNLIVQTSPSRDYVQVIQKCMIFFPSRPYRLHGAMQNKPRTLIDDDVFDLKSACQQEFIVCAIVHIRMGDRTDPSTGIPFRSYQHNVAWVPCLLILETLCPACGGQSGPLNWYRPAVFGVCSASFVEYFRRDAAVIQRNLTSRAALDLAYFAFPTTSK